MREEIHVRIVISSYENFHSSLFTHTLRFPFSLSFSLLNVSQRIYIEQPLLKVLMWELTWSFSLEAVPIGEILFSVWNLEWSMKSSTFIHLSCFFFAYDCVLWMRMNLLHTENNLYFFVMYYHQVSGSTQRVRGMMITVFLLVIKQKSMPL